MTIQQVDRMVRQANPVPDLSALEPIDASVLQEQRRTDMQTHDRVIVDDEGGEPKRGRNILIGIAATAAIIISALLLLRPLTEDPPVAGQPTASATEIATAFFQAYASYDVDTAASYLAADAFTEFGGDPEGMGLENRWREAIGFRDVLDSCVEQTTLSSGSVVRCTYDYHALRSDEIGLGPFSGSYFDFTVLEGKIVAVSGALEFMSNGFSAQVWEPFARWIAKTYPDEVVVLYTDRDQTLQRITEESIPLWKQRSLEYVEAAPALRAAVEAEALAAAFVGAYADFDIDRAASYLAPDADLFLSDLEEIRLENRLLEAQGFKLLLDSCEQRDAIADGIVVRCLWDFHSIRSDEMGLGPFSGSWFDLTVLNGEIVAVSLNWGLAEFSPQVWEPFAQWVADTHPEDVDVMYLPGYANFRLTEESIALWEQRSREYVEVVGG